MARRTRDPVGGGELSPLASRRLGDRTRARRAGGENAEHRESRARVRPWAYFVA
jgi:hypothetical protein